MRKYAKYLRLGLQFRSLLVLTVVIFTVMGTGGWSYYASVRKSLRHGDSARAEQLASVLAMTAQSHLCSCDHIEIRQLAAEFLRGQDVRFVAILGDDGQALAQTSVGEGAWRDLMALPVSVEATQQLSDDVLAIARPVVIPDTGNVEGAVRLVFDTSATTATLGTLRDRMTQTASAILLCVLPLGYILLSNLLVKPLHRLVEFSRQLATGDFSGRMGLRRNDEIGELAGAFDTMAGELSEMRADLMTTNANLERKVAERTEQIRHANMRLEQSMVRLRTMAETDPLTGLANRRRFATILEQSYAEAVRYGHDLTCVMCDLDYYKKLNDTLGHQLGDKVLKMTADTIRSSLRGSDSAARYGGDEFVILLPHTSLETATAVAQRIRQDLVLRAAALGRSAPAVTISVGVASLKADRPTSGDALVCQADQALYVAKDRGKNRIVAFCQSDSAAG